MTSERQLGRGGGGTVDLETRDGREVAIKRVGPAIEARLRATHPQLIGWSHPHVARVLALEERGGGLAVVLEHVRGLSLDELVARASEVDEDVPAAIGAHVMRDAADGLEALHAMEPRAWTHGDVSPGNVLVGSDGLARLIDLDLAGPIDPAAPIGTIPYAAPERLAGGAADGRADVFSLGATVLEVLTRAPLFVDDERDPEGYVVLAVERLTERDDLPPGLIELLVEMLAPDPADRPSAEEVARRAAAFADASIDLGAYVESFRLERRGREHATRHAPRVAASTGASWHVKGATLIATIEYLLVHHGEEEYARVLDHVTPRVLEALGERVDAGAWYDGRVQVELTEAAARVLGGAGSLAGSIGRWSAEQALSPGGPYQTFRDKGLRRGVEAFIRTTEELYGLYVDTGEWRVEDVTPTSATCRLIGAEIAVGAWRSHEPVVARLFGYLARGMELCGARDVQIRVEHIEGELHGYVTWR